MKEISVNKLQDMIKDKVVELIDVRENNEYQYCKVEGSKHIRMNDIPSSIHELSKERRYAIICHSGVRSAMVCEYLLNLGYNVVNVRGGIDLSLIDISEPTRPY